MNRASHPALHGRRVARRFAVEVVNQSLEFPHFLASLFGSQGAAPEFPLLAHLSVDTTERTKSPVAVPKPES